MPGQTRSRGDDLRFLVEIRDLLGDQGSLAGLLLPRLDQLIKVVRVLLDPPHQLRDHALRHLVELGDIMLVLSLTEDGMDHVYLIGDGQTPLTPSQPASLPQRWFASEWFGSHLGMCWLSRCRSLPQLLDGLPDLLLRQFNITCEFSDGLLRPLHAALPQLAHLLT